MSTKKPSNFNSLSLKKITILFFLISLKVTSQVNTITRIHTDWNRTGTGPGYWTSNSATGVNNRPTTENNLLAFEWKGRTFSTGVDDAKLTTNNVTFDAQRFRALKIQTLAYTSDTYFLQGSMIDGSPTGTTLLPAMAGSSASGAELASRLTDGANGLSLGTGVANIAGGTAEFKIGTNNLNTAGINDDTPDILVTQVASPGGGDVFKFVNAAGATVGNEIAVNFGSIPVIGTYSLDLFRATNGAPAFTPGDTRDIRMLGFDTSFFGINSTNAAQVDRFVVVFSGSSDCAFIAVNRKSLKLAELGLIKKATLSSCGKAGDVINYKFDIKNTGEVPITNISISDPMPGIVFSSNSIASLAVGATATINATYTVTANDVTAGKIVNSATVTGTDPSLNTVTDISGDDYNNNIPTTTILLAAPTVSAVHNVTCPSSGSIDLTNLPSSGTWEIKQTGTSSATYNGTGTTFTVPNLVAGSYTFRVSVGGCNSPATASITVGNDSSTTWNGSAWSAGLPGLTKRAIINSAVGQPFTANTTMCALTINVPTGASDPNVVIPEGVTLTVTHEVISNGKLVFEDGSSLVQTTNAVNTGEIVYKRKAKVSRYDLTYWSMPVTKPGFTMKMFSPNTLIDKYFILDPATAGWVENYDGTFPMLTGKGYSIRAPQSYDATVKTDFFGRFTGVPNNGDINVTVVDGKWNLIGNPYPSAVNADTFIRDNPGIGALYFWAHVNLPVKSSTDQFYYYTDDFVVYNGLGGTNTGGTNAFQGNIGAAQGFIVKAPTTSIHFNNNQRTGTNSQFYKTAESDIEKNRIWINLKNTESTFKQILLGYATGATNALDSNFDAISMGSNPAIDFYSIGTAKKLTIQGRALPFEKSDVVPLGYMIATKGDYTISIDHADGFFNEDQEVFLEDKTLGKTINLRLENYTFTTAAGTFNNRFAIRYTNKTLGIDDVETISDGILVAVKNKIITISSSNEAINEVSIYNILGHEIFNKKKVDSTNLEISNLQVASQVLLVKTSLQNGFISTKKIIIN
nr:T9SS sorting signal type C domain-containing protein [uncultured Flavobacterium sp.]